MIYRLYIPKQFNKITYQGTYVTIPSNFDHIRSELKKLTTGWTEYDGQGFWVNDKGKEFSEPVKVFEIVISDDGDSKCYLFTPKLQDTLRYLKSCLNQESMFYTRNDKGFYV